MANSLFLSFGEELINLDVDLMTGVVVGVLGDNSITPNVTTHDFFNDIAAAVQESATLSGKSSGPGGNFDAADLTFTAADGDECEWLAVYENTAGGDSEDPLVAYYDTFSSGMPVTPNGGDITAEWHEDGLFTLIAPPA